MIVILLLKMQTRSTSRKMSYYTNNVWFHEKIWFHEKCLISRKMSDFTKNVWFHDFYRFRRSRDWKYSANSCMKVQMPQQDQRLKKHWLLFRILVTGNWFYGISRKMFDFTIFFSFVSVWRNVKCYSTDRIHHTPNYWLPQLWRN